MSRVTRLNATRAHLRTICVFVYLCVLSWLCFKLYTYFYTEILSAISSSSNEFAFQNFPEVWNTQRHRRAQKLHLKRAVNKPEVKSCQTFALFLLLIQLLTHKNVVNKEQVFPFCQPFENQSIFTENGDKFLLNNVFYMVLIRFIALWIRFITYSLLFV